MKYKMDKWKDKVIALLLCFYARKRILASWYVQLCLNDKRKFYSVLSEEQFQHTDNFVDCESLRNVMILLHNCMCTSIIHFSSFALLIFFLTGRPISIEPLSIGCVWMLTYAVLIAKQTDSYVPTSFCQKDGRPDTN